MNIIFLLVTLKKLLCNVFNKEKTRFITKKSNFILRLGLKIKIKKSSRKARNIGSKDEKAFSKLMNNSGYDKAMEIL